MCPVGLTLSQGAWSLLGSILLPSETPVLCSLGTCGHVNVFAYVFS